MKMRSKKAGVLIACEGISGSGKSKSIQNIYGELLKKGYNAIIVEWNSNRTIRWFIKVLDKAGLVSAALYSILQWTSFFIDYLAVIRPQLSKGGIVIADRYIYTGLTRDRANGVGRLSGNTIYKHVLKPDMLLYYETDPEVCYKRITERNKKLYYTNKKIIRSKLKNKDLYYLKKMKREYGRLFADPVINNDTEIYIIVDKLWCENEMIFEGLMTVIYQKLDNIQPDSLEGDETNEIGSSSKHSLYL